MGPVELVVLPEFEKRVVKALNLFVKNPSHNSLRLKKRESDGHWEISFSDEGRILFDWADEKTRRKAILLSVGHHKLVER